MRFHVERLRKANPVSLGNALGPSIKELGLESNIFFENVKRNWEKIVGSTNAKNTKPLAVKDGILTISVSSPVWMTQARFYKSTFIDKLNQFNNHHNIEINEIFFKLERP